MINEMKNLILQINLPGKNLEIKIKEISDEEASEIMHDDVGREFADKFVQNESVISFYKSNNIDLPSNIIFDGFMQNDNLYVIDDLSTRDWLD